MFICNKKARFVLVLSFCSTQTRQYVRFALEQLLQGLSVNDYKFTVKQDQDF